MSSAVAEQITVSYRTETVWNVLNMCNASHSTISEHSGLAVQNLKNVTLSGSVWRYDALSAVKHEQAVHLESFLNGKMKLFRQGSMLITSELLNSKKSLALNLSFVKFSIQLKSLELRCSHFPVVFAHLCVQVQPLSLWYEDLLSNPSIPFSFQQWQLSVNKTVPK